MRKEWIQTAVFLVFLVIAWEFEGMLGEYLCLSVLPVFGLWRKNGDKQYSRLFAFFHPIGAFFGAFLAMLLTYNLVSSFVLLLVFILSFGGLLAIGRPKIGRYLLAYFPFAVAWTAVGNELLYSRLYFPDVQLLGLICYLLLSISVFELGFGMVARFFPPTIEST